MCIRDRWVRDAAGRVTSEVGPVFVERTCGVSSCAFGSTPPAGPSRAWAFGLDGRVVSFSDETGATTTVSDVFVAGGGRVETVTGPPHGSSAGDAGATTRTVTVSRYDAFDVW